MLACVSQLCLLAVVQTKYLRMYTTQAADKIPDLSLDFVYIDARHDYCGVREDLVAYWSKIRSGGILAGHDYMDAHHQLLKETNQDWSGEASALQLDK